jgi:hypothetical protein
MDPGASGGGDLPADRGPLSPGHVWVILRHRLGWTLQRPERRASERDEEAIARWVQQEWPRIKKDDMCRDPLRLRHG